MDLIGLLNSTIYYKVQSKLKVIKCDSDRVITREVLQHTSEPSGFFETLFNIFTEEDKHAKKFVLQDDCTSLFDKEISEFISQVDLARWSIFLLIGIFSIVAILLLGRVFLRFMFSRCDVNETVSFLDDSTLETTGKLYDDQLTDACRKSDSSNCIDHLQTKVASFSEMSISFPQCVLGGTSLPQRKEIESLLDNTISYFLKDVDKYFISLSIAEPKHVTLSSHSSLTSPKLSSRATWRKPRSSAPIIFATEEGADTCKTSHPQFSHYWALYEAFSQKMKWNNQNVLDTSLTSAVKDSKCCRLFSFFEENCSIKSNQWALATFTVNYSLFLLEKLLQLIPFYRGIKFQEFVAAGSCRKGHKIISAKQFDVLMSFTPTQLKDLDIIHSASSGAILPGQLVIVPNKKDVTRGLFKECFIQNKKYYCMSSGEVTESLQEMISKSLLLMSNQYRKYFDKLPFTIQMSASATLHITVDTRSFQWRGFDIPEIVVKLIPALELPVGGWFQPISLYATPVTVSGEIRKKCLKVPKNRTQSPDSDLCWILSYQHLEESYLHGVDKKMRLSGVDSCHIILLKILKFLFSKSSKTTLINKGELDSYHVETIVYYLLLESGQHQWKYSELCKRFSDAVVFLKSAVKLGRLPNLFVENPHLTKQNPFIKTIPFLTGGRAVNLFADMNEETAVKITSFIDQALKNAKLAGCVTDEVSSDMWEYEFFLFN